MTREELKEYLPHREPMLLVDEITMDENNVAHGIYHVRGDEFFLQGHFPGQPVVPGVILCEIIAQSCALLLGDALKGKTPFYTGIDKVKFKQDVYKRQQCLWRRPDHRLLRSPLGQITGVPVFEIIFYFLL